MYCITSSVSKHHIWPWVLDCPTTTRRLRRPEFTNLWFFQECPWLFVALRLIASVTCSSLLCRILRRATVCLFHSATCLYHSDSISPFYIGETVLICRRGMCGDISSRTLYSEWQTRVQFSSWTPCFVIQVTSSPLLALCASLLYYYHYVCCCKTGYLIRGPMLMLENCIVIIKSSDTVNTNAKGRVV